MIGKICYFPEPRCHRHNGNPDFGGLRSAMRQILTALIAAGAVGSLQPAFAQTPTYAPSNPLVAPGEPGSGYGDTNSIPSTPSITIPSNPQPSTVPQNQTPYNSQYNGGTPVPASPYPSTVPSGNSFDPPGTVVTPGTAAPYSWGAWYPGYWMGYRPGDPPYGGRVKRHHAGYQGMVAPYGGSPCNTCPPPVSPCGPRNLDFGRGYDGFMGGW